MENQEQKTAPQKLSIQAAIIVAGLIVAGAIFVVHAPARPAPSDTNNAPTAGAVNIKNVVTSNEPYAGNPNAPVTLAYWSDFQCPYCKQFDITVMPTVMKDYVASGKVKIVFKDYQFLGEDSYTMALNARAIWELYPDKYLTWREAMFNAQDAENGGFGDQASITALSGTIAGIDAAKVASLVNTKGTEYRKTIDADNAEGSKFGVQGTPAFITGTKLIPGGIAYADLARIIDAQLK